MIFKVVFRSILKRPFLNLVKIIGLSLALSGIIFIGLFLKNELTYDMYHSKAQRIYRLTTTHPNFLGGSHFARTMNPDYMEELKNEFPEVEEYVRLGPVRGGIIKYNDLFYNINQAFEVDSTYHSVFDSQLIIGNGNTVLNAPGSMVLSESFAKKIFGNTNPIGEILTLPPGQFIGEPQTYTVSGVMKDYPQNSHFHPDFIVRPLSKEFSGWAWTYMVLAPNADPQKIEHGFASFIAKVRNVSVDKIENKAYLQALNKIHLRSHKLREIEPNGNITYIYVLAIAALVLLLISISNYANLNIGMSVFSAKYLAINKLLGSSKLAVIQFFLIEGVFIVLAAIVITLLFALPINLYVSHFFNQNLISNNTNLIVFILLAFALLSIVFGMLPVLNPILAQLAQKGTSSIAQFKKGGINRGLVIFQYAVSIALIIAVIIISKQTQYALNSGLGVKENNVLIFEEVHADIQQKFEIFKEKLLQYSSIQSVSAMMEPPGGEANDMFPFEMEGYVSNKSENEYDCIGVFPCDHSFASLFNFDFLAGSNFNLNNKDANGSGEYIINEAAMKRLGCTSAADIIGKAFTLNFNHETIKIPKGHIIGVVKDFHLSSLKKEIEPLVMFKRDALWLLNFVVAYQPGMQKEAIDDIKTVWKTLYPEYPLKYEHVSTMYQKVYKPELLQAKLLSVFTIIALFICSMGLLGLALIITQYRTKEIGIRKVNGAKTSEILLMLNKDFVKWVAIAFAIATPIAYYAMNKWLENFAYKTELSWWIFALAGLLALGIALVTVSFQSWKAATKNPVQSLRYE